MYIKIKEPYEQTIHIMKVHHETEDCYVCELKKDNSYLSASKEWVLAKSENLEELCDLFIDEETKTIFHKHNGYVINWKTNMVYSLKELAKSFHNVKGAIYTDKGLIYVAKIDNEGKLVLI